ncbi:Integral membrane family protein [Colletotrichum higginsianum IMI 349063]|nr:Integral membrane family protein [Colletotrichum higginsianum IMI 349063]OBR15185.1 Integral membrane family protein [Colletotrichum higginsianum IMI 349063]
MAQLESHGPLIGGITWFLCFFCGAFLALRVYAKLSRGQKLWWDDYIMMFSWTCLFVESIITQMGINLGFGRHYYDINPQTNLLTIAMYTSVGASVSCFASTGSKVGFGVTLLRLTTGWYRAFVWFAVVTLTVVMLPSATLTWLKCTPVQKNFNRQMEGSCWDESVTLNYGIFNAAWCAAMDFALALVPWKLIWGMRLRKHEKLGVCFAMSLGWLAGVCAIIKGVYLVQLEQGDFFFNGKDVTIWTAVETATAIVGSSIPVLRVFIKEKASTLGYDNKNDNNNNHNNNSAQNSDDMELNTYRSAVRSTAVSSPLGAQNAKDAKGGGATDDKKPESGFSLQEIELKRDDGVRARPVDLESQVSDRIETIAKSHHDQFM